MGLSKREHIQWTDGAHVKLVKAVIKIEKEMTKESNSVVRPSTRHRMAKWKRIVDLLPPDLRGRTRTADKKKLRDFKCSRQFFKLVYAYRNQVAGKSPRSAPIVQLTETVFKVMKKREDLLNLRSLIGKKSLLRSGNSNSAGGGEISDEDHQQLSANDSRSCKVQSISSVRKQGKVRPSEYIHKCKRNNTGHSFDSGMGREAWHHVDHDDFTKEDAAYLDTLGSRCVQESADLERKSVPAPRYYVQTATQARPQTRAQTRGKIRSSGSATGITPSSARDPNYNEHPHGTWDDPPRFEPEFSYLSSPPIRNCVRTSAQERLHTCAQTRARTRDSDSATNSFRSVAYARYNEHLHGTLDEPLRRVKGEFARLSSWVQNLSVNEMNLNSAIRSGKRRKLNAVTAIKPFEKILDESVSTINDLHIQALFEQLRIQYAVRGLNSVIQDYLSKS